MIGEHFEANGKVARANAHKYTRCMRSGHACPELSPLKEPKPGELIALHCGPHGRWHVIIPWPNMKTFVFRKAYSKTTTTMVVVAPSEEITETPKTWGNSWAHTVGTW